MQTPGMVVSGSFGLTPDAVQRTAACAKIAEERGFRNFLVTEAASDALALAQHIASVTSRIHVGTAIFNIYLRPPLLAALQALTIDAIAPGRLFLGVGTSHAILNQAYGIPMDKPLTALRTYVATMTSVFRGEHPGLAQMAAVGIPIPRAERKIPIFLGGVSPKSIQLAGEIADGIIPAQYGPHTLKEVVDGVAEGAQHAGRSLKDVGLIPLVHCCVCADRGVALRSVQQQLAFYASMPFYNRLFVRHGFDKEAERVMGAVMKGDRAGAAAAISERMAAECAIMGSPQECFKQVEAFEQAGAAYVLLYPMPIDGDSNRGVQAALDAFAQ
ncbi:MAG: LLM class flavin-dependent oxidoreductase [Deltaproteobacteria bacterium]|nr:LLM class flavin-dependent oxidoreductase [Deltaproteobacteria bacterium]